MKKFNALLGLVFLTMLAFGKVHPALAQAPSATDTSPVTITLPGTLTDDQGKPVAKAKITVEYGGKSYGATSEEGGKFDIADVDISQNFLVTLKGNLIDQNGQPMPNTRVVFNVYGTSYPSTTNETGAFEIKQVNLAQCLKGCWIPFVLLFPGIFGLFSGAIKDWWTRRKERAMKKGSVTEGQLENQFLMAFGNALVWTGTLLFLAGWGVKRLHFFSPNLAFEFYVPILGFLGALLYMFHMFHKGEEKIPKGKEFGMRVLLAPYVAIVVVVLFGRDLGLVDLQSTAGRGTLAFFSGLLVVTALQQIIESGQERLGKWREKARYEPSEIAKQYKLTQEQDLKLRQGDIAYLVQLEQYSEDDLREKARKIGFDENLLVGLKKQFPKVRLKQCIGDLIWEKLEKLGVEEIEDFANLSGAALEELNEGDAKPKIDIDILKKLQKRARETCLTFEQPANCTTKAEQPPQELAVSPGQAGPDQAE